MQQTPRKKLGIKPTAAPSETTPQGTEFDLVRLAVERKLCMAATYNRQAIIFAPHILYTKHDDPFVDGVVTLRDGKVPVELKVGAFKLAGLSGLTLSPNAFETIEGFDPSDEKYAGVTVASI